MDSIPFAGESLGEYRHVCAFFDHPDDEYRLLLPFIKDGFDCGDRAFHIVDPALRADHWRRLEEVGIAVDATELRGQLEIRTWEQAYLREGHFDQDAMLAQ